jgi:predicted oxidoreductase
VTGIRGAVLEPSDAARGVASSREEVGAFEGTAQAVVVTSGGIGGNHDLVRQNWPARLGPAPKRLLSGVPASVDGRMLVATEAAGASVVNADRMWHYTEGIVNHSPVWERHGVRILPGPSSLWLDATGNRLPVPLFPGFDTLGTLAHIGTTGYEHTWFLATHKIVEKEFALSGSEQNPDLTGKDIPLLLTRFRSGAAAPVEAFKANGADFVVADDLAALVDGMNALTGDGLIELDALRYLIEARDREMDNAFTKDLQIAALRSARSYRGDKLIRVASPHKLLDPKAGPLIAVRLHILTRKTLGGLETDLAGRVLRVGGEPLPGVYAAGEVSGFGGGGMHGYNSLEGTFLGGCLFSGRQAGRAAAQALG